ncbi:Na/Pi cotransporter family protein [Aliidiomarina sp. Khilg15.8]
MSFTEWAMSLGGLGFLLLGMGMMTDGLRSAAGDSLHGILERSTQTRLRALITGFSITALVQSSSAVIVATLGFTNAGMLRLRQAAWVVFGSNVGTTMTAWIVALIGLKIRIDVVALPLIGLGMLLKLFMRSERWQHVGVALSGFGILFFGLGMLRDAFENIATIVPVAELAALGGWGIVLGVLAGAVLTSIIQSSSAALAIILTASVTGVFTPLLGASLVIGANLGTTSTTLLASIGATPNARRLALVHVSEKVFTGSIALLLLLPMWWLADFIADISGGNISTALALYHTLFNVLGVALMFVFAERLLRLVERWVKQPELTSEKPRYLDDTVLEVPAMGVGAMHAELKRVFKQLLRRGREVLQVHTDAPTESDDVNTSVLLKVIEGFSQKLGRTGEMAGSAEHFLNLNWAMQELTQLRVDLNQLRAREHEDIELALNVELQSALAQIMGTGQLKTLSEEERKAILQQIKGARKQRRSELLQALEQGEIKAADVTRYLNIIALCEESATRILRITSVLYPV